MGGMELDIGEFGETITRLLNEKVDMLKSQGHKNVDFRFKKRWLNAQGEVEE